MRCLVTGTAGFIGFHLARRLLEDGHEVVGVDGFTPYYDLALKERRHAQLVQHKRYVAHRLMLEDDAALSAALDGTFDIVLHLAAQPGVRYSFEAPSTYLASNVTATFNLLEWIRHAPVRHVLIASTSSIYGASPTVPFLETDRTAHPLSIYAATKAAAEQIAHSYSHLFSIPTTVFRFFTVYGPWGRPDMAIFKFTRGVIEGEPIEVYNQGHMERDFTYIDDLVEAVIRLTEKPPEAPGAARTGLPVAIADLLSPVAPYRILNIGRGEPTSLEAFIAAIETAAGRKAVRKYMPMQPGDVVRTFASAAGLEALTGYRPPTTVADGVRSFVDWYRAYTAK